MSTEKVIVLDRRTVDALYYHLRYIVVDTKWNIDRNDPMDYMVNSMRNESDNKKHIQSLLQETVSFNNGIENVTKTEYYVIKYRMSEQTLILNKVCDCLIDGLRDCVSDGLFNGIHDGVGDGVEGDEGKD